MVHTSYILLMLLVLTNCTWKVNELAESKAKIDGISLEASRELIDSAGLVPVERIGAEWVALMPYAFVREKEGIVHYNWPKQWVGERVDGIREDIKTCRKLGFKIMLKPHVWVGRGIYTGDYIPGASSTDLFESSYSDYILTFARLAEEMHVELFCIGTEWRALVKDSPQYWNQLIDSVRTGYSGKLTYAANWDEYKETPFWDKLDYIGINAYFPLTDKKSPTNEDLRQGWTPFIQQIERVSGSNGKPILFTEYGYRSVEGTAIKPWESYNKLPESAVAQQQALEVLYQSVWNKHWMAGGFLWKWKMLESRWEGRATDYTPQHKPAEEVVKKWYAK